MSPRRCSWLARAGLIACAALGSIVRPGPLQAAGARVYVSTEDAGDIAVIDASSEKLVTRIHVGKRPRGIKLSHDGKLLYVAMSGSPRGGPGVDESKLPPPDRTADGIAVVDLARHKLIKTIASGQDPESFDLSPDGKRLFVSNEESAEMSVVDLQAGKILKRVKVGGEPEGVTLRPDGKVVYVTCEVENQVAAVDTSTLEVIARIETGARPRAIAFTGDGATAFVTAELGGLINVIDGHTHKAVAAVQLPPEGKPLPPRPMGVVLSPDGKHAYVSNGRGTSVAVIDVAGRKLDRMIEDVGTRPWGIAVSGDGKKLFTANGPSDDVSIIDVATGKVRKKIKVTGLPWGVAISR